MKCILAFLLLVLGSTSFADSFKCVAQIRSAEKQAMPEVIWKGSIQIKMSKPSSGNVIVINEKSAFDLEEITKGSKNLEESKKKLAEYNGKLIIGLVLVDGVLKLSQGRVDTTQKNQGPFEALAWASPNATKIGLKNFQRDLEVECVK